MAKTLLVIGLWSRCAKIVALATGNGWRVLHTPRSEDIAGAVTQSPLDLIVVVTGASAQEWKGVAQAVWTLCRHVPVLTFGSGDNHDLLFGALAANLAAPSLTDSPPSPSGSSLPPDDRPATRQFPADRTLPGQPPAEARPPSGIEAALRFIETHYADPITLDDAAQAAFYSRCHFCRVFKEQTGCSFVAYLAEVRLRHAAELLLRSELSITEIAFAVGFNDLSHFERVFRNRCRQTPTQFRQESKHSPHSRQNLPSLRAVSVAS